MLGFFQGDHRFHCLEWVSAAFTGEVTLVNRSLPFLEEPTVAPTSAATAVVIVLFSKSFLDLLLFAIVFKLPWQTRNVVVCLTEGGASFLNVYIRRG